MLKGPSPWPARRQKVPDGSTGLVPHLVLFPSPGLLARFPKQDPRVSDGREGPHGKNLILFPLMYSPWTTWSSVV